MPEVFLSASVPLGGRGRFEETSQPFLVQSAVRELVIAVCRRATLVWGGHPAITPMVWAVCEDLQVDYSRAVVLYQTRLFEESFPAENQQFRNVVYTPNVDGDRDKSLETMRLQMLRRPEIVAGVFVGGMEGVLDEYRLFRQLQPNARALVLGAPGGAARIIAESERSENVQTYGGVDFVRVMHQEFAQLF